MFKKHHHLLVLFCSLATTSCIDESGHLTSFGASCLFGAIGGILIIVWFMSIWYKSKREKEKAVEDALRERTDFTESKVVKGKGGSYFYLATDDSRKKVFYVFGDKKLLFDYEDVVAVDVVQDGEILASKKSMENALGGAIIGGTVLGNDAGAFLGAVAFGTSSSSRQISNLSVHVLLRNQPLSSIDCICYCNPSGSAVSQMSYNLEYRDAKEKAQQLYDIFRLILNRVEADRRNEEKRKEEELKQVREVTERITASQELMNVSELYLQGLITDEEYARMKEKIIGKD